VFVITTVLTAVEAIGATNPLRATLVIVVLAFLVWRRQPTTTVDTPELRFDDLPEPAVATLGLERE